MVNKIEDNTFNGTLYLLLSPTDHAYIGQTSEGFRVRWRKHRHTAKTSPTNIGKAIRKYGADSFRSMMLITNAPDRAYLDRWETLLIKLLNPDGKGYNIAPGGRVSKTTPEGILKMKASLTGRKLSDEHKKNIGAASKKRWLDPSYRQSTSKLISSGSVGKKLSENHKSKLAKAKIGRTHTQEHNDKISQSLKRHYSEGLCL